LGSYFICFVGKVGNPKKTNVQKGGWLVGLGFWLGVQFKRRKKGREKVVDKGEEKAFGDFLRKSYRSIAFLSLSLSLHFSPPLNQHKISV